MRVKLEIYKKWLESHKLIKSGVPSHEVAKRLGYKTISGVWKAVNKIDKGIRKTVEDTKLCPKCNNEKALTDFHATSGRLDGRSGWCKDCNKDKNANRYEKRKDFIRKSVYRWRNANKERFTQYLKEYCKTHLAQCAVNQARRRAKKAKCAINDFNKHNWKDLLWYFNGRCAYCLKYLPLTQDHMTPISKGGNHTLENIVPACRTCNARKGDKNLIEFAGYLSRRD